MSQSRMLGPIAAAFLCMAPVMAAADDRAPNLNSTLKVQLESGKTITSEGGRLPVELVFTNHTPQPQTFQNSEYRFALLNRDGVDAGITLATTQELRTITLSNRSDIDRPNISVGAGKLVDGEKYFLVVSVRNLTAVLEFTARRSPVASYRAIQANDKLTVIASGDNPTPGYKNELIVLPMDVYPPEFKFTQTPPAGIVIQIPLPFSVHQSVPAPAPVQFVYITDSAGRHKVVVTQGK